MPSVYTKQRKTRALQLEQARKLVDAKKEVKEVNGEHIIMVPHPHYKNTWIEKLKD